jgi:hypothetical protein
MANGREYKMRATGSEKRPFVGGACLIVLFSVLCLVVFAILTLTTQTSARRLSEVSADSVRAYYDADTKAELTAAAIRRGNVPDHVDFDGEIYSYSHSISDTRSLYVELSYKDGQWTVLRWQVLSNVK